MNLINRKDISWNKNKNLENEKTQFEQANDRYGARIRKNLAQATYLYIFNFLGHLEVVNKENKPVQ